MNFLGLGKTLFNSSVTLLKTTGDSLDYETIITERITRNKYSGAWPEAALKYLLSSYKESDFKSISENSDVITPKEKEDSFDKIFPFYESIESKELSTFCSKFNEKLSFYSHHKTHAYNAIASSPFDKTLVLVIDGGGSNTKDLMDTFSKDAPAGSNEYLTLYSLKESKLELLDKDFQSYQKSSSSDGKSFSNGVGAFYESISEYIFNDKFSAGKVMGLAPFGEGKIIKPKDFVGFLEGLNWSESFQGDSKKDWEGHDSRNLFNNLASTAQKSFEDFVLTYLKNIKKRFPEFENLIFTGGCALNCTFNWKLIEEQLFSQIYIPPSPNDSGISLGCAYQDAIKEGALSWSKIDHAAQNPYKGPLSSVPNEDDIKKIFSNYRITKEENIEETAAKVLDQGQVIAWFQGRSEIGPRALGNRSILASVKKPGLKDYLNREIKFRENFRPYACSVLYEDTFSLFDCPKNFENPFMSFAVPIKNEFKELLKEVAHVDNTNRMQSVRRELNPRFHKLLSRIKEFQGQGVLLNTSLNIMGEPIIESIEDLHRFFQNSVITTLCVGDYLIEK